MATKEDNKYHMYFIYALILAIFGMVIYLVVVNQEIENQYYLTLTIVGDDSVQQIVPPTYPSGANGTLRGGMNAIRSALVSKLNTISGVNLVVPGLDYWSFNAIASFKTTADVDYQFVYTFPAPSEITNSASALGAFVSAEYNLTQLFSESSVELQTWAAATFVGANQVRLSLTYGTRDSATIGSF